MNRNEPCWCGSGMKFKKCHGKTSRMPVFKKPAPKFQIMTPEKLVKMRASCKLAANILEEACSRTKVGTTTEEINTWVHELTLQAGAYPSPLNYPKGHTDPKNPRIKAGGFPKSVCTSINDVVCHGIPSPTAVLKDGDIVNIDVTVYLDGFHGDTSRTIYIGTPSEDAKRVTEAARESLMLGIETVRPGSRAIDIGHAINNFATPKGFGVVQEYTGHGIGEVFHADPQICHYSNLDSDCVFVKDMTFTIEPMINLGTWKTFLDHRDNWTVYTMDRKLSAQFEHTILVTEDGYEILTLPD